MMKKFWGSLFAAALVLTGLLVPQVAQASAGFVPISKPAPSVSISSDAMSTTVAPGLMTKPILNKNRQLVGLNGPAAKKSSAPSSAPSSALATTWYYQYTASTYTQTHNAVSWDMDIRSPWKSSLEFHTLAQIAVCKDGTVDDCIEFGWIKSNASSICAAGPDVPCLFTGRRTGGNFGGYNAADTSYVDDSANTTIWAGISLNGAVGGQRNFQVIHNSSANAWEVWYGTGANGSTWKQRVGYFPDSIWGGNFTTAGFTELYTEIVSDQRVQSAQCTDAGTNVVPTTTAGFRMNNITLSGRTAAQYMDSTFVSPGGLTGRGVVKISDTEGRYGGPGGC